jgi:hypothetical protein
MKRRSRALTLTSLAVGLALFVYVVRQAGPAEILSRVRSLGAGFALVILLSSARYVMRALAWLRCMTVEERCIGLRAVLRARLIGEAVGDLTAGPVVAEPLKVMALGGRLPLAAGISSLAVENISYAASCCVMVTAGTLLLLAAFTLSESLRAAGLFALAAVLAVTAVAVVVIRRRWALLSGLASVVASLLSRRRSGEWAGRQVGRLRTFEDYVFDFYARRPGDFFRVALYEFGFHAAGVMEVYLTLRLAGFEPTAVVAFVLESVNRVFNIIFSFVPVLVGVDEAGTALLTEALGFGAASGVTLAIIRKARMFFWIGVGLILLAGNQPQSARRSPRVAK